MPGKQKEKSEATKKRLIQCAGKLFYEKGFDNTAVREIVKAAGVAQGTFYLYFNTKFDILAKIYKTAFSTFHQYIEVMDLENPKFEDIDLLIDITVGFMQKNPGIIKLLHNSNITELMNVEKYEVFSDWIMQSSAERWIIKAISKGIISNKPAKLYSRIVTQIAHELLESAFLYGYPDKVDVIKEEVKIIVKKILL
ncbi:MAG: TetR/AcrR family transcriptional regulator [Bacillota bacterium]